jgi:ceramide glucosyltransferase
MFFAVEIFAGGVPPMIACAIVASTTRWPVMDILLSFALAWYLAEAAVAYAVGWHLSWRSLVLSVLRDLLLPVLWFAAWMGDELVWHGNVMRIAQRGSAA